MSKTEWKEYEMSELIEEISMGPFGSNIKVECFTDSGVPVLNGSNLVGFRLNEDSFNYVTEEKATSLGKANAHRGDIVITHRGTLGQIVYIPQNSKYSRYVISQSQFRVRCNEKVIPEYLVYYFHSRLGQHKLLSNASQVGVPSLARPTSTFQKLTVSIPPIAKQKEIVKILSSLDDKIKLNNAINRNLEEQAQAIFKSWFVDFEPFGGIMPENWEIGKIGDLVERTINGDWGKDEPMGTNTEEVFCIRGADIPEVKKGNKGKMPTRYILPKNYQLKKLEDGDLVVEISGGSPTQSTGRAAYISEALLERYNNKIVCTNFCKAIKFKKNYSTYMYFYWIYLYDKGVFFNYENGTTGIKNLDVSGFLENEEIVIPSMDFLSKFNAYCSSAFKRISANGAETEQLGNLRDTLLSQLLSGKINKAN